MLSYNIWQQCPYVRYYLYDCRIQKNISITAIYFYANNLFVGVCVFLLPFNIMAVSNEVYTYQIS